MAGSSSKKKQKVPVKAPQRPIDRYFDRLEQTHRHTLNRWLTFLAIPLFFFALLGLVWITPFPAIGFLKQHGYDTFINWASIFIAIVIYGYLRLSPTLSYAVLLTIGLYAFFIVKLEYWAASGGPAVWTVCTAIAVFSLLLFFIGSRVEARKPGLLPLWLGPVWLWHFFFRRFGIPY